MTWDWTDGALVEPMAVSVHGLRYAGMKPGDVVAVVGSAPIGLSSIASAHAFGSKQSHRIRKIPATSRTRSTDGSRHHHRR